MAPRKKTAQKRRAGTRLLTVAVTDEQRERWRAAADADRRSLSDWLRLLADRAAEPRT